MGPTIRTALVLSAACLLATTTAGFAESESVETGNGHWNDLDLLEWVAAIPDGESRYGYLETLASFERLQNSIEAVKQMVLHDARTEQEAVEGLRMILKHLAVSTHDTINNDFRNPLFAKRDPRNRDIGAYNPDAEYDQAYIDGRFEYKISGQLGSVSYVSITLNGSGGSKLSRSVGYLDDASIRANAAEDGSFTVWLTRDKPGAPGVWLPLPVSANGVVIRQYVSDRTRETLATFSIEAVGDPLPDVERTSDVDIAKRLSTVADYLLVSSTWHRTLLPQMREQPNTFVSSTGNAIGASAANSENYYQMAYFEIGEGEQLRVDFKAPDTVFWNLTSATFWHETQRYLTDPVSLTSAEAVKDTDGTVRFVIASEDPGHPNWIKTFGHERGFLILRMVGVKEHPLPRLTKLPIESLASLSE